MNPFAFSFVHSSNSGVFTDEVEDITVEAGGTTGGGGCGAADGCGGDGGARSRGDGGGDSDKGSGCDGEAGFGASEIGATTSCALALSSANTSQKALCVIKLSLLENKVPQSHLYSLVPQILE